MTSSSRRKFIVVVGTRLSRFLFSSLDSQSTSAAPHHHGHLHSDRHIFRAVCVLLAVRDVLQATTGPGCRDSHPGCDHIHPAPRRSVSGSCPQLECGRTGRGRPAAAHLRNGSLPDATSHAAAHVRLQPHSWRLPSAALSTPAATSATPADANADAHAGHCSSSCHSCPTDDESSELRFGRNGKLRQTGTVQSTLQRTVTKRGGSPSDDDDLLVKSSH